MPNRFNDRPGVRRDTDARYLLLKCSGSKDFVADLSDARQEARRKAKTTKSAGSRVPRRVMLSSPTRILLATTHGTPSIIQVRVSLISWPFRRSWTLSGFGRLYMFEADEAAIRDVIRTM